MGSSLSLWPQPLESHVQVESERGQLLNLEGTLQRVNYPRGELTVVAQGKVWAFQVEANCQLRFDDQPAILRCFHPLDRVRIIYEHGPAGELLAKGISAREKARMVS
jgi:hypothetical protein